MKIFYITYVLLFSGYFLLGQSGQIKLGDTKSLYYTKGMIALDNGEMLMVGTHNDQLFTKKYNSEGDNIEETFNIFPQDVSLLNILSNGSDNYLSFLSASNKLYIHEVSNKGSVTIIDSIDFSDYYVKEPIHLTKSHKIVGLLNIDGAVFPFWYDLDTKMLKIGIEIDPAIGYAYTNVVMGDTLLVALNELNGPNIEGKIFGFLPESNTPLLLNSLVDNSIEIFEEFALSSVGGKAYCNYISNGKTYISELNRKTPIIINEPDFYPLDAISIYKDVADKLTFLIGEGNQGGQLRLCKLNAQGKFECETIFDFTENASRPSGNIVKQINSDKVWIASSSGGNTSTIKVFRTDLKSRMQRVDSVGFKSNSGLSSIDASYIKGDTIYFLGKLDNFGTGVWIFDSKKKIVLDSFNLGEGVFGNRISILGLDNEIYFSSFFSIYHYNLVTKKLTEIASNPGENSFFYEHNQKRYFVSMSANFWERYDVSPTGLNNKLVLGLGNYSINHTVKPMGIYKSGKEILFASKLYDYNVNPSKSTYTDVVSIIDAQNFASIKNDYLESDKSAYTSGLLGFSKTSNGYTLVKIDDLRNGKIIQYKYNSDLQVVSVDSVTTTFEPSQSIGETEQSPIIYDELKNSVYLVIRPPFSTSSYIQSVNMASEKNEKFDIIGEDLRPRNMILSMNNELLVYGSSFEKGLVNWIDISGVVSATNNLSALSQYNVYPIPAQNLITLESINNQIVRKYLVHDVRGGIVLEGNNNIGHSKLEISTNALINGLYFLRIVDDKGNTNVIQFLIAK
ncbi:MAG: T9SS type A sorting domain-containing protein [Saprospiraceae bacterium]|nr:T9SS type A sorting domain-containing protein [Saprospiraceae bacterium]